MNQNEKESPKILGEQEYERAIYLINSGHFKESISLFHKLVSFNYPPSFLWLYFLAEDKNEKQNWKLKAAPNFSWYQSKAQDGKSDSLNNLGFCFHYGIGTEKDYNKAVAFYTKAAQQGFAAAQFNLGYCYYYGEGVPKDINKAVELYTKAAEQELAIAQFILGICYQSAFGVPKDINKAVKLYTRAAEQGLTKAQRISLTGENVDMQVLTDVLKLDGAITSLNINYSNVGNKGAQAIAEVLKMNKTLTSLSLDSDKIGNEGVQAIADAIKINNTLASLTLIDNDIGNSGSQAIANALKVNASLLELNLSNNNIWDLGGQAIASALKVNASLLELHLSKTNIGDLGAQAIADALKINKILTGIDLTGNNIGDIGVKAIADALKVIPFTVKEIELTNTSIENIEQALGIKKSLLKLVLSNNKIGNEGMDAIAEMLKVNNSLKKLHIANNSFEDISKLGDALKYNRSLIELRIGETKPTAKELEKALDSNICLLSILQEWGFPFLTDTIRELLKRNEEVQATLSERIFKCKNPHLSLLDYKILERVNVAVIFNNIWKLHETQETVKTYEEYLREYWELISLNTFSKYFLFILGICKLNQIPPFRSHLLGIPKEILDHIGSFLNPEDFSIIKTEVEEISREKKRLKI